MKCHRLRTLFTALALITLLISLIPMTGALASETGIVNATVILRESSTKNSTALQTLPAGEEVTVIRTSGDWYRVRYGNFTGYIMKIYVDLSESSVIGNQSEIADLGDPPGPLYIGDEGNDVEKLQEALKILGYYSLRIDGIYGTGSTAAVALYQQANGLEPDGIAGKMTIRSIFGSCASTSDITVSGRDKEDTEDSTTTSSSSDSSDSQENVVSSFSEIGSAPDACEEGDTGTDVIKLQQALYLLGYYSGVIDGDYGTMTTSAVMRFQKNRGMSEDGIAGSSTIRVLFSGTSTSSSSSSSSSSASSSTTYETLVLDWFDDNVTSVIPKTRNSRSRTCAPAKPLRRYAGAAPTIWTQNRRRQRIPQRLKAFTAAPGVGREGPSLYCTEARSTRRP